LKTERLHFGSKNNCRTSLSTHQSVDGLIALDSEKDQNLSFKNQIISRLYSESVFSISNRFIVIHPHFCLMPLAEKAQKELGLIPVIAIGLTILPLIIFTRAR